MISIPPEVEVAMESAEVTDKYSRAFKRAIPVFESTVIVLAAPVVLNEVGPSA